MMNKVLIASLVLSVIVLLTGAACEKTTVGEVIKETGELEEQPTEVTEPETEPECTSDDDCGVLEVCEDNECKGVECKAESDCEELELCESNECKEVECKTDDDCEKRHECVNNECKEKEPEVYNVEIIDLKFLPTEIVVSVGTTVVWTNKDFFYENRTFHMVAAYDGTFRSSRLGWMDTFSYTFTEEDIGEHTYFDVNFKDNMKTPRGKVTVIP